MPSLTARTVRLQCAVRRVPLQATSGARMRPTSRPASQGMGMIERAISVSTTPSSATPPSQSVAQPAMDHLRMDNGQRMRGGDTEVVRPWGPGTP